MKWTYYCSSSTTFVSRDVFDGPLYFGNIETLAPQWDNVTEYGLDFGEFVLVAGDEVEFFGRHGAQERSENWRDYSSLLGGSSSLDCKL